MEDSQPARHQMQNARCRISQIGTYTGDPLAGLSIRGVFLGCQSVNGKVLGDVVPAVRVCRSR
jgi:hypothetical protein